MPVLASAATTAAVCTMVLGKSPGRVRSAQFGAAPTCCARMAQVAASSPHSSHLRVIRIVIPPIERAGVLQFVLHKKTYNDPAVKQKQREQTNLDNRALYVLPCRTNASRRLPRLARTDRDARRHAAGHQCVRDDGKPRD